ncbi:MAG: hypothetical protein Q7R45_13005 [Sulfuricaulis sp.]|nr:hypothetical protein [Sulfuricaulis sp.]
MTEHSIHFALSLKGQEQEIRAGRSGVKERIYTLIPELVEEALDLGASIDEEGFVNLYYHEKLDICPASASEILDLIAVKKARIEIERLKLAERDAEKRAKSEAEVAAHQAQKQALCKTWAALPLAHRVSVQGLGTCRPLDSDASYAGPLYPTGAVVYDRADLKLYVPAAYAEAEIERQRLLAEVRAAEKAAEEAEIERTKGWLAEHAPEHVARYAEGFMDEGEIDNLIIEWAIPFVSFTRLQIDDLPHGEDCHSPSGVFRTDEDITISAETYTDLVALRTVVTSRWPGATVTPRRHTGRCDSLDCAGIAVHRYGALVRVEVWPGRTVTKEVALA